LRAPLAIDLLLVAYLAASGLLALASWSRTGAVLGALHAAGIVVVLLVARIPVPRRTVPAFFRVVYPVALTPVLYLELARLDQLLFSGYFDTAVQRWEAAIFGVQLSVAASEWIPSLAVSEVLHFGYVSYYLIVPTALILAWRAGGPRGLQQAAFSTALAFFVCYLCFAVFPVAGPRYDFPRIDGPPSRGVIFALVHQILEGGSSKGTAFPSSHVAATVSAWLGAARVNRKALWILAPFAVSLTLGTVYGRFHYGVDASAGLLVAFIAVWAAPHLIRVLGAAAPPHAGSSEP
jgi:membrane-associated phospholipid phosphatase